MASKFSEADDQEPMTFTNYKPALYKRFAEMFKRKDLTDAILICENQHIHVHKFLLSASSSFFNKIFKAPGTQTLHIRNVKYADLLTCLEYIYKGEVALQQNKVGAFLSAAKNLSIPITSDDIESVTLKYGLTFEHHNQDENPDTNDDDGNSCSDDNNKVLGKKQSKNRCETIRIDKHNLSNDENRKPITPGVVEVSREEFFKRMLGASKHVNSKKLNHNLTNNTNQAEMTPQSSSQTATATAVDAIDQPSTSNGSKVVTRGPAFEANIQARKRNIDALRHRVMRNVKSGINDKKSEKDRLKLIKLEADLVTALKNSSG